MDEVAKPEPFELGMGQELGKVALTAVVGMIAGKLSAMAFDGCVKAIRAHKAARTTE